MIWHRTKIGRNHVYLTDKFRVEKLHGEWILTEFNDQGHQLQVSFHSTLREAKAAAEKIAREQITEDRLRYLAEEAVEKEQRVVSYEGPTRAWGIDGFAFTDLSEVNELGRVVLRLLDEGKINL